MSGPQFFQTRMGQRFYESTMPALVKQLELLNKNLEKDQELREAAVDPYAPIPFVPAGRNRFEFTEEALARGRLKVPAGSRFRSDRPNKANKPKSLWDYNEIQFARLLCEIRAACEMEGFDQVMESMDLDDEQMDELWKRAEEVWENSKKTYCPLPSRPTWPCPFPKIKEHLDHISHLEVAWYGPKDNGEPASVTVECTRCGEVVAELYDERMETDDELIDELCSFFEQEEQVVESTLDDYVHDMASKEASATNNAGVREQLVYLRDQAGEEWLRSTLLPFLKELKTADAGELFSELCEEAGIDGGEAACENCGKPCSYHTELCLCDECKRKAES